MKSNTRLQYVVKFISDVRTTLESRTVQMTNPVSVFLYIKTAMGQYAPPYAPPVLDIGTVAEEGEEEEEEEEGDGPETAHGAHHGGAHAPDAAL